MERLRFSRLKLMGRSPLHYANYADVVKDSAAMRMGRLIHSIVLGGPAPIIWDGGIRRGKAWESFLAGVPFDEQERVVSADEFATAEEVSWAVAASEIAQPLLQGIRERRIEWTVAGRACAGTPDVVAADGSWLTDLKTTVNAEPGWFSRHASGMGYLAQLAWYADGLTAAGLAAPQSAFVVAVENKAPFAVTVFELTPRALDIGRRTYRLWLERLLICEKTGSWPAYAMSVIPLDIPEDVELLIDGEEVAA
jgi:hypothetical protein